jgi:hypothetical protein
MPLFAMLLAPGWPDARIDRCQVVRSRKRPGLSRSAGSRRRSSLSLPSEPHRLRRRRSRLGRTLSPSGRWTNHGVASPQPRRHRSIASPARNSTPCRQRAGTPRPGVERGLEPPRATAFEAVAGHGAIATVEGHRVANAPAPRRAEARQLPARRRRRRRGVPASRGRAEDRAQ